jgi:ABC-type thiamine transport system ATPase subunit
MDEPLANLDPPLKARMLDLVRAEADAMGATLLYVAHEPDEVVAFGGRVLRIERGRLAAGAAPEGVR